LAGLWILVCQQWSCWRVLCSRWLLPCSPAGTRRASLVKCLQLRPCDTREITHNL